MKNVQFISLAILFLFAAGFAKARPADGFQDNNLSRTYDTGNFNELFLEGAFKVYLIQGSDAFF